MILIQSIPVNVNTVNEKTGAKLTRKCVFVKDVKDVKKGNTSFMSVCFGDSSIKNCRHKITKIMATVRHSE